MYVIRATAVAALVRARVGVARGALSAGEAEEAGDAGEAGEVLVAVEIPETGGAEEGAREPVGEADVTAPPEGAVAFAGCVLVSVRSSRVMACPFSRFSSLSRFGH
ncbi:hypothetical protein ABZ153_04830 [Streptomyces sp. NPDC006290]|uniref:hypothetical protein n=1 Tax=Streptomyces sp. NPDC006290 TaxID=3156745 RepID=UPI0033A62259